METIDFYINGNPKPLKRHRITRGNRIYDPSSVDKKEWMKEAKDFCPEIPLDCPITVELEFVMKRPKSHYGTGRNSGKLKNSSPKEHLKTPDLDNLVKFVLDAMNGHFYKDDSRITKIICSKKYNDENEDYGTYVTIKYA